MILISKPTQWKLTINFNHETKEFIGTRQRCLAYQATLKEKHKGSLRKILTETKVDNFNFTLE